MGMKPQKRPPIRVILTVALTLTLVGVAIAATLPSTLGGSNPTGSHTTLLTGGPWTDDNPFFQRLGTNGRSCITCHEPAAGWTLTPSRVQSRFNSTNGLEPLFRTVDGANSPTADVSTVDARRIAYSMLLTKGLIRVGMGIPATAEFSLVEADDPYGYASASELSLFRRPLPATNLKFLSTVMWDGRMTFRGQTIHFDLKEQANGATLGHAQATQPLTDQQREDVVAFEKSLFTAQTFDRSSGGTSQAGAQGGPTFLSQQPFFIGINTPARDPNFDRRAFKLFDAWGSATGTLGPARQSVYRGQEIFNGRQFAAVGATCTNCHNTPNVGTNSVNSFFMTGLSDAARRTPDMPLYTFRCNAGSLAGRTFRSTDPGLALVTGRCSDFGKFKVPGLRALAARAPYFHNGLAATLEQVVDHYDRRFAIGLTAVDKADLVAFLRDL